MKMATLPILNLHRSVKFYKQRRNSRSEDYRTLYRFDEQNVEWIASHFLGESTETRGGALSQKQRIQIFLRYISDPGFQTGVAEDIGVDHTTVCKTVHKVKREILKKSNLWIRFPNSNEEIMKAKQEWQESYIIPFVIGAIDCTHIRITKPKVSGDEYINRKRFPSINVQATCNAKECFTSVNAEFPGSVHDSRIFKNSDIFRFLKEKTQETVLLGDSGYGSAPWLLTPYEKAVTDVQKNFNKIYATERVIIERCFGQLKRRFTTLHYKVRVSTESVSGIIVCCFILHNVAKYLNDADDFPELPDEDDITIINQDLTDAAIRIRGQQLRNRVANMLYNRNN